MMEKYYLIGTTILGLALNVPTFALHQFGYVVLCIFHECPLTCIYLVRWDLESATCWYKNPDNNMRLRWIIGTQSFWIALAAAIETVCSGVVLIWMFRFKVDLWCPMSIYWPWALLQTATKHILEQGVSESTLEKNGTTKSNTFGVNTTRRSAVVSVVSQNPRYRKVILRIG